MKIGRNDPCPFGSGRKYKHCCLEDERKILSFPSGTPASTPPGGSDYRDPGRSYAGTAFTDDQMAEMMLSQTGFADAAELERAMRAYEKHCESLPENAVPPTFMEFLGRPNAATESQKSLSVSASQERFESLAAAEAFANEHFSRENAKAIADFEGLSSSQIHRILTQDLAENRDIVSVADDLPEALVRTAEIADVMMWLLSYFADNSGEVKLTSTGNFNRSLCRAYCARYPHWFGENRSVPLETSLPVLVTAHDMFAYLGYADETSTRAWLTDDGVDAFSRKLWVPVFVESFRHAVDGHDWQNWIDEHDRGPFFDIIQRSAIFLFYLLRNHPEGTIGDFIDRFVRAFPAFIAPAQGKSSSILYLTRNFADLFFDRFCTIYGLVSFDGFAGDLPDSREVEYRVTPLFRELLVWHI